MNSFATTINSFNSNKNDFSRIIQVSKRKHSTEKESIQRARNLAKEIIADGMKREESK